MLFKISCCKITAPRLSPWHIKQNYGCMFTLQTILFRTQFPFLGITARLFILHAFLSIKSFSWTSVAPMSIFIMFSFFFISIFFYLLCLPFTDNHPRFLCCFIVLATCNIPKLLWCTPIPSVVYHCYVLCLSTMASYHSSVIIYDVSNIYFLTPTTYGQRLGTVCRSSQVNHD